MKKMINAFSILLTVALDYQKIKKGFRRISKIKSFMSKYN